MAQATELQSGARPENPSLLSIEACKTDDVTLLERALSLASQPNSRNSVQDILNRSLKRAAARKSPQVLQYALDHGADVAALSASDTMSKDYTDEPSRQVLDILLAHGWDVNTRGPSGTDMPLLRLVVRFPELVRWCLEHGARVDVPDTPPRVNADGSQSRTSLPRPTVLGAAAAEGTVETFELLRANGAPLDPRTLHLAVENAALLAPKDGERASEAYTRRMDMVRHLLDDVKLDVNAVQNQVGSQCSTPLCCVARRATSQDFRELVNLLLDRGARIELEKGAPEPALLIDPMGCAQAAGNAQFSQAVQAWRLKNETSCENQDV